MTTKSTHRLCLAISGIFLIGVFSAHAVLYTGPAGAFDSDTWNSDAHWDSGIGAVPLGVVNVEIEASRIAWAVDATPSYTGNLTLRAGSVLGLGVNTGNATVNALGTGTITMESGSLIIMCYGGHHTFNQSIHLTGDATIALSATAEGHNTIRTFAAGFTGAYALALAGLNGNVANLDTSNEFTSLTADEFGSDNWKLVAGAEGSLGVGNVTINNTINLVLNAANAMFSSAELYLNGPRSVKVVGENKLVLNNGHAHTVAGLYIDGNPLAAGTYDSSSGLLDLGGNNLISGNGSITVVPEPAAALLGSLGLLALFRRRR